MMQFLMKTGHMPMSTLDDSLAVFGDLCAVADLSSLDFYWFKYERSREYKNRAYEARETHNLSFLEWAGLYARSRNKKLE